MESLKKDAPTISTTEDAITISPNLTTGKHRAIQMYKGITISCENDSATIVNDTARNTIRIIIEAVELGWFRPGTKQIGVMGRAHSTTLNDKKETVADKKHITVVYKPGGANTEHLYLMPDVDNPTVSATTYLDTTRPTPYYDSMNKDKTGDKTQGTKDT